MTTHRRTWVVAWVAFATSLYTGISSYANCDGGPPAMQTMSAILSNIALLSVAGLFVLARYHRRNGRLSLVCTSVAFASLVAVFGGMYLGAQRCGLNVFELYH